jgi:hypothetical protein
VTQPSPVSQSHSIIIRKDEDSVASIAAQVLAAGLHFGQPALLLTTGWHLGLVRNRLQLERINPDELIAAGTLTVVDGDALLKAVMVGDAPDPGRFWQMVGALLEQSCSGRQACIPVVYSDMADRLWHRGNKAAALSLEILWNRLATAYTFSLICGYCGDPSTPTAPTLDELREVCEQHNHVIKTLRH